MQKRKGWETMEEKKKIWERLIAVHPEVLTF